MKKFILLALVILVQSTLIQAEAHAQAKTNIQIDPYFPANCLRHDYPLLNYVADVRRVSETKTTVAFQFRTYVGACEGGQYLPTSTITTNASVGIYRNKLVLFQKETPVLSMVQPLNDHEALVTLEFDKKSAFKKRPVNAYTMTFYPQGRPQPIVRVDAWGHSSIYTPWHIYFPWKVVLTQVSVDETSVQVGVGQP